MNRLFYTLILNFSLFSFQSLAYDFTHSQKFKSFLITARAKIKTAQPFDANAFNCQRFDLSNIEASYFVLPNVNFTNANLSHGKFKGSDFSGSNFINANLTEADLSYSFLENADFTGSNLTRTNFRKAILLNVKGIDKEVVQNLPEFEGTIFSVDEITEDVVRYFNLTDFLRFFPKKMMLFSSENQKDASIEQVDIKKLPKDETEYLELLPEEVLLHICEFLDLDSLNAMIQTCRKACRIGQDESLKNLYPLFEDVYKSSFPKYTYIYQLITYKHPYALFLKAMSHDSASRGLAQDFEKAVKYAYGAFSQLKKEMIAANEFLKSHESSSEEFDLLTFNQLIAHKKETLTRCSQDLEYIRSYVEARKFEWHKKFFNGFQQKFLEMITEMSEKIEIMG